MSSCANGQTVFVEAPARLHFGVLDLRGTLGRWFGGIGAAAPAPSLLVSASAADTLEVEGEDADRAAAFARELLAYYGVKGGARLCVHRTLPAHVGLGSGTQLALAVARALTELYGVDTDAAGLARAVGRGAALGHRYVDVHRGRSRARGRAATAGQRSRPTACEASVPTDVAMHRRGAQRCTGSERRHRGRRDRATPVTVRA